ncbi:hypothetical protein LTR10_016643 [Elasticomyces elasticus]|uniref:FAD-binding domain-containing protein n=1 Tax=Exophiala sideris TaxID=1016849 RepID=A0ABR0JKM7_9EURO|nr:hypothetical protein LTR10_016643 [Elasticomyces elasticus]KAK5035288.1 hypothetical protein LTS07_002724 [Exophiala sideris]KAK5039360.1 hypothetical protein LTR13_003617 [Exophiala sideris]KAK5066212.1 hypothetical protein LTR69_002730 [Exophiala sideris]KAK5186889.1 hypothetical protein LTR44_000895 [Eurotiomycetes sp. CCFEE 6388]
MADEVAIIGAGLSGLALALALHQQSIKATIYESRPAPLNIGGAVMLSPNALKVLDALGVYQEVRSKGFNLKNSNCKKSTANYSRRTSSAAKRSNRIYRFELIDIILSRIKAEGIPVVFGCKYARVVEETDEHVIWESADGEQHTASWLVGADGIHSTVRKYLYPDLVPRFTHMAGITAAVPTAPVRHLGKPITKPLTIISEGKGAFVVAPQKVDGSEMLIVKQRRIDELDREGWDHFLADRESLIKFMQEDADSFGELALTSTQHIDPKKMNVWPFYVIPELDKWASSKRRVVILGDSAHAIPPSAGQGINQAFEDVYMFALLLAAAKGGNVKVEDALTFWQRYRQDRVNKVLELNKQIDLRRLPKDQLPGLAAEGVAQQKFDMSWLYAPDFKADVDNWVKSVSADVA